ncbi:hypothetical protein ACFLSQ_03825 [Bacteroidota bacterium]
MKNLQISLISFILAIALVGSAFAQNYEFKVMASKGKPVVQKDNSKTWNKIKLGTKIFSKDKIKLTGKSYISLVHKTGKTVELKKEGTYSVKELSKKMGSKGSNVSKRFSDYLLDEISSSDDLLASGDHRDNMEITGSVERSMNTQPFINKKALQLNSPRKANLLNNVFTVRWHEFENAKEYEFILSDRFDKPITTKNVHGTFLTVDASELNLDKDTYYFWKVKAKGDDKNKSDDACFLILSDEKAKAIRDTVEIIKSEVGGDKNASAKIILAAFYEQNYIIDEALKAYREAVVLAPDVDIYTKLYKRFLNRIKVTEK